MSRVAILGAGLAGLWAASQLVRRGGMEVILLEAREAPGGRVLSLHGPGGAEAGEFDLGPTWFWPELQPELADAIAALGLSTFPQQEAGDLMLERSAHQPPQRLQGGVSSPAALRLQGGMAALVKALQAQLPPGWLHTGQQVQRLRLQAAEVVVDSEDAQGRTNVWPVDRVLLALPPRLAAARLAFDPPLPPALAAAWAATATWMAPHAKYVAVYDTPFWRAQGLSGAARSAHGPLAEVHDASVPGGDAALFGFVGLPASTRRGLAPGLLQAHCRAQLVRLFGPKAGTPTAEFLKDWALDPFTATEADASGPGQHPVTPPAMPADGAWRGRLTGVASEWSPTFAGYIAGALDAATRGVAGVQ